MSVAATAAILSEKIRLPASDVCVKLGCISIAPTGDIAGITWKDTEERMKKREIEHIHESYDVAYLYVYWFFFFCIEAKIAERRISACRFFFAAHQSLDYSRIILMLKPSLSQILQSSSVIYCAGSLASITFSKTKQQIKDKTSIAYFLFLKEEIIMNNESPST